MVLHLKSYIRCTFARKGDFILIPNRINQYITNVSTFKMTSIGTLLVLSGSIPIVYLASIIGCVEYNGFLLAISIVLPLLLAPLAIILVIKQTMNLEHVKEHLAKEIEINKSKDVLLYEQARFALMGEMLANISHQWKQPLHTINLSVINARMQSINEENIENNFDIIEENVNYLASTINDFMSYFDKKTHSEIRNLEDIIGEVNSIAGVNIKSAGVELLIDNQIQAGKIKIASSISQIILNLINNAKDALSHLPGDKKIKLVFTQEDKKLFIRCCDNGSGVDDAIKEQIFNPYFTTKSQTKGTGIGLYMSKQITDKFFNGELILEEGSKETCFSLVIPYGKNCYIKEDVK